MSSPAESAIASTSVRKAARAAPVPDSSMTSLVLALVRPYSAWWLLVVFIAMLVEIAMSLASPWPLKLVLDDALGNHQLPAWLAWAHDYGIGRHALGVALFAGIATVIIASIGAVATYIDNYYTTSIGQWVANEPPYPYLRAPAPAFARVLR